MDELTGQFGGLSTNAAEWIPTPHQNENNQQQRQQNTTTSGNSSNNVSDLNASTVKEFVPGQGWVTPTTSSTKAPHADEQQIERKEEQQAQAAAQQQQQQQQTETTVVVSGPSPPPPPSSIRALHSMGLSSDNDLLWRYHRELSLECMRQMEPNDPRHKAIPLPYCNAFCLDTNKQQQRGGAGMRRSSFFGYPTSTFQVTNREDGKLYCLKRFDNVRCVSLKIAAAITDRWTVSSCGGSSSVQDHPGIAPLYQCFIAQRAVFFVHQYIPGARNLAERLLATGGQPLSENIIWSCITQLVSVIRTIHGNNLAIRTLRLQHILSNSDSTGTRLRLRLGCLGIVDALEFEARKHVQDLQMEDIRDLGRLILGLATGTEITSQTENDILARCEAFLAQNFSRDLHNLAMTLIQSTPHHRPPSIVDVSRAIASRCFDEQDAAYRAVDRIDRALSTEYDSGRAFRLLLKLGFVNERPELGPNRRWAQSGDCYVLTLFRDYVFHQADGAGNPVMDLGHVVSALNKLDAADEEKIVLASRDGKSLMVVSYADVARCLESAFHELCTGAVPPSGLRY